MIELKLQQQELINSGQKFIKILCPWQIPIHPIVYNSDFAYTPNFVKEIKARIPQFIKEDITIIEGVLEESLGIEVNREHMSQPEKLYELKYKNIRVMPDSDKRIINVGIGATTIGIIRGLPPQFISKGHPMDNEKLKQYAVNYTLGREPKCHIWYMNNYFDQGLMGKIYLRNFAILFNNLGLEISGSKVF